MSDTDEAWVIAKHIIQAPPILAVHTTAPSCVCEYTDDNGQIQRTHYYNSSTGDNYENGLIVWVKEQLEEKPDLRVENFRRIENDAFDNIYDTIKILREHILPKKDNPTKYKRSVIRYMGEALDTQTSAHFKKRMWIPTRLKKLLGEDNAWVKQYLDKYHIYYTSIKHRDKQEHIAARKEIGSVVGRQIAVAYFEAIRKFFVWYYKDSGNTHPNLKPIDYSLYGLDISIVDP